jgi:hypothetical protein
VHFALGKGSKWGVGSSLIVHEAGKAYLLTTKPGDAYDNRVAYFVDCVRKGITPAHGAPEQARLAVATAAPASVHSLDVFDEFPDLEWEGLRSGVRAGRAPWRSDPDHEANRR